MINLTVDEESIVKDLLGIDKIPSGKIRSPFREDKHPSFSVYRYKGTIFWRDFSTDESGNVYSLIKRLKGDQAARDTYFVKEVKKQVNVTTRIGCRYREWKDYDYEYWNSYGVSVDFLKKADVHPVSFKVIRKGGREFSFKADKYAYAFLEHKDDKTQMKIYQPFNKDFKWCSSFDHSVWSLWNLLPEKGDKLIITSSLKDAANLWTNLDIPAVALQGEGYLPKPSVMEEVKSRFRNVYVFYDNDYTSENNPGKKYSIRLAEKYNLIRLEIPSIFEAKDPSDLYKKYGKEVYLEIIKSLL